MRTIGIHDPSGGDKAAHLAAKNDLLAIRRIESSHTFPHIAREDLSAPTAVGWDRRNYSGANAGKGGKNDVRSIRRPSWPERPLIVGDLTEPCSVDVNHEQVRAFASVVIKSNPLPIGRKAGE